MGLELAEQLRLGRADVIFFSTGGGNRLIGHVEGVSPIGAIASIGSKLPRLVAVQAAAAHPGAAFENGVDHAPRW